MSGDQYVPVYSSMTTPPSRGRRTTVLVVLTVLLVVVVAAAWFLITRVLGREGLDTSTAASTAGVTSVRINGSNADITVLVASDDQVHVHATGTYSGDEPDISVQTIDGESVVSLACPRGWLTSCDIDATVEMPADLPLLAVTDNGDIEVSGLTAALDLTSDNGGLTIEGGTVILASTDNGSVTVQNSRATDVTVRTDNGDVDVELLSVPTRLEAATDNGNVDLAVSGAGKYVVDTASGNGEIRVDVGIDTDSANRIKATTDNGDIRVRSSS